MMVAALFLSIGGATARATMNDADRLGRDLTPMGAERAGGADGAIPPWEGGLRVPPDGYVEGRREPDPFPDDTVLFTITHANYREHLDHLTAGQAALFEAYPGTFRMRIFPARRTAAFPRYCYEAVKDNAVSAELDPETYDLRRWRIAVPFPIPRNGLEALNNHLLSFRTPCIMWSSSQAIVNRSGDFTLVRMREKLYTPSTIEGAVPGPRDKTSLLQEILAPPRLAGQVLLAHAYSNKATHRQQAWIYNPGQRRVRKAPRVEYDGPGAASDGLRTNDDYLIFNGAPDRYHWTLKGKREVYAPYNSHALLSKDLTYGDILNAGHINPDHVRYERRRVWVIEARLKPDSRHIYRRRVFYQDEDSWLLLMADTYDNRGVLWRAVMAHCHQKYTIPAMWMGPVAFYDLQSGRYLVQNLSNEEPMLPEEDILCDELEFTPAALRRLGRR